MATNRNKGRKMKPAVTLTAPIDPELKELIGEAADKDGLPMNEWVASVLARHLGRPELAKIPRRQFGRPRKRAPVPA